MCIFSAIAIYITWVYLWSRISAYVDASFRIRLSLNCVYERTRKCVSLLLISSVWKMENNVVWLYSKKKSLHAYLFCVSDPNYITVNQVRCDSINFSFFRCYCERRQLHIRWSMIWSNHFFFVMLKWISKPVRTCRTLMTSYFIWCRTIFFHDIPLRVNYNTFLYFSTLEKYLKLDDVNLSPLLVLLNIPARKSMDGFFYACVHTSCCDIYKFKEMSRTWKV